MRIALCLSGQVGKAQQMLPQLAAFARGLQADVFISTWAQPGTKVSGIQGIWHVERMFGAAFCSFLPRWMWQDRGIPGALPGFEAEMEARIREAAAPVTAEALLAHFPGARIDIEDGAALDLGLETQATDNNSLRMLYKLWRCNELRRAAEKQSGQRYDVVLRARPDIVPSPLSAELLAELAAPDCRTVLVDDILPGIIGDKCAVCGPDAADDYAALFGIAVSAPARPWRGIHHELHDHMKARGLQPRLHRVSWQWAADAPLQALGREVLLRHIADGPHAPGNAVPPAQMQALARILAVADRLAVGDVAAAQTSLVPVLADAGAQGDDEEALYHALVLATLLLAARQEARPARAAAVMAWWERARLGRLQEKPPEAHAQAVAKALSAAGAPPPPFDAAPAEALAWLAQEAADPLLAPALERLRTDDLAHLAAALSDLRAVEEGSSGNLEALRTRGFQALGAGNDPAAARDAAAALIRIAPASWYGYDLMGHVLERAGDHEGCLEQAQLALGRHPGFGPLHARVGCILTYLLNRPQEAVPHLERATALWPDARAWHWLAVALERSGDRAKALAAIDEALNRDGGNEAYRAVRQRIANP